LFNELYEAWLQENENPELQRLTENFYLRLSQYIKSLEEEARGLDEKSLKGRLKARELEWAKKLAQDLLKLRFQKIFSLSRLEGPPEALNMTEEELAIYNHVREAAKAAEALLEKVVSGISQAEEKMVLVRFLKDAPALVDSNLKTYGPFKAEDVAYLPKELAEGLIRHNIAKRVKAP